LDWLVIFDTLSVSITINIISKTPHLSQKKKRNLFSKFW